jgi:hypothetical protein
MNINRNVLKIVAGALLVASLPAGAQVLGGNLGGAASGALGGGLGQGIHGSGGIMGGGSITGPDVAGTTGKVRERARQAGEHGKDAATNATGAVRSRAEHTQGSASGAAGVATQAGTAANGAAASSAGAQPDGVLLGGATSANAQRKVVGRDVSAGGAAASEGTLDRNGLRGSASGQADASVKKSDTAAK